MLLRWLPERSFVFAGDQGYGIHEQAFFASQQEGRLTLVSRFYADANLYEPSPVVEGKRPAHRPCQKEAKLPRPQHVVAATAERPRLNVAWYGGGGSDCGPAGFLHGRVSTKPSRKSRTISGTSCCMR